MTQTQAVLFLLVIVATVLKAIALKPCSNQFKSSLLPLNISFWLTVSLLALLPLNYGSLLSDINAIQIAIALSVIKGVIFYFHLDVGQRLAKETSSSRTMSASFSIGIIASVNYSLFGEHLTTNQLISAGLMFFIGVIFYFKGHIRKTSKNAHSAFFLVILIASILAVLDHLALAFYGIHWYTYLLISSSVMLIFAMVFKGSEINFKIFNPENKILAITVFTFILTEYFLMSIRGTLLPVTLCAVAITMSIPIVMIYMAVRWGESSTKDQAMFGVATCAAGLISFV